MSASTASRRISLLAIALCMMSTMASEPEHITGWRGDGTGRYPDATPPTTWSRTENGEKKNILWETKMPSYSWATPIIVGDKIFVRSEPYDLICLNKKDGRILWIRSHPAIEALSADEKKANPAFLEIEGLMTQLKTANDTLVAQGWSEAHYKVKWDLQKRINELMTKADPKYKLPPDMWQESTAGFTGTTPCSDGKLIYFTSGCGVTAAYDLDGNKKWARYESIAKTFGEHGTAMSPTLVGEKLLVPIIPSRMDLIAINKTTGADIWRQTYPKGSAMMCGVLPFKSGGADYCLAYKNFIRVSDGKSLLAIGETAAAGAVIQDDMAYVLELEACAWFYKLQPKAGGDPNIFQACGYGFPRDLPPSGAFCKAGDIWVRVCATAPLYHDGLIYVLQSNGRLTVCDAKKAALRKDREGDDVAARAAQKDGMLYSMFPPFDFRNPVHRHTYGCGIGASPALGGKYIYLMDNAGCTIVIEPGGEYKQIAKNNINTITPKGYESNNIYAPRPETTLSTPIFEGDRIYIRGEQYLYCIGEK